ncbi:MAG: ribosome biogenesis GTP-binding protein YsxC [Deltaproteobacteria bacterium]|nr:ribosome biogenesis GTP-binding protein YsxC [Deltaproteobacteria bacterium]
MRTYRAELLTVAPHAGVFPAAGLPEIAVVGRSNAGKSTLINMLMGRRALARTSARPGKTRAIVFFDVEGRFVLADLPGYGFSRAPKKEQAGWRRLVDAYLGSGRPIAGVIALFDIRREPDELDRALLAMLGRFGLAWLPVWTKADKLARSRLAGRCRQLDRLFGAAQPGVAVSSLGSLGRQAVLDWIETSSANTKGARG